MWEQRREPQLEQPWVNTFCAQPTALRLILIALKNSRSFELTILMIWTRSVYPCQENGAIFCPWCGVWLQIVFTTRCLTCAITLRANWNSFRKSSLLIGLKEAQSQYLFESYLLNILLQPYLCFCNSSRSIIIQNFFLFSLRETVKRPIGS